MIWTAIIVLLLIAFLGLLRVGLHFSSDILHELVKRETNGYYQLSFEEINIDIWDRAIKLRQVLLKPDFSQDFQGLGLDNLYDLELTGLHIDLKSISSIYTERKLVIENVRIIDPKIHVIRKNYDPNESFSFQTGNLYKEISDYLKVLRIDFFSIENADFKHSPSEMTLGNVDLSIGNFLIDSASQHDQRFYSESIELEIRNQQFILTDSIHELSFDRLLLSTVDSVLIFENLILAPISEAHASFGELEDKIVYNIRIPQLKLKGVDYFSAYRSNSLTMEELALIDSEIFFEEQSHAEVDQKVKKNNSLLKQLIEIFDEVKIGKLRFINTHLDIKTNEDYNHNYQHIQSKRSDIVLYNFYVDSTNYQIDYGKKYFDDFDIIIKSYSSYLPDSIHTFGFDLLQLSSFDSSLIFKNIKISNNEKESTSNMFLMVELPSLHIKGLNYLDALIHQKLSIREMNLQNPNIVFESKQEKSSQKIFSPDSVYTLLKNYFKEVGIKNLQLNQGQFSLNKQLNFSHADLSISNFSLNNQTHLWHDVLDDIKLDMRNVAIREKSIHIRSRHLQLDHIASRLLLNGLRINHNNQYRSVAGEVSKLSITGIDLDSISMGNFLAFDSVRLINPQLKMEILKPGKKGLSNGILRKKLIQIVNGKVLFKHHDGTALRLDQLNTELIIGQLNHIRYGQARQINLNLPQSLHLITIDKLSLTTWRDIYLKDIAIKNLDETQLHKVELNSKIPALTLHGLKQDVFWQHKRLEGDSLVIETADIDLKFNDISTSLSAAKETGMEIQFKKIKLEKTQVTFSDHSNTSIDKIATPALSLTLEGFQYPQKSMLSPEHLIYSDNVTLNIKNLKPIMTNGDEIVLGQLSFNKRNELITVDHLSYKKANGTASTLLPSTKILGLDLHAFMKEKNLKIDSIHMKAARFTMDLSAPKNKLQPTLPNFPESIVIKYFSSAATEIEIMDSIQSVTYAMHHGNIEVHEFYTEGAIVWDEFLKYTQNASISGQHFSLPLDDGYQLNIDQYHLQHPENTMSLDHVSLTSKFTPAQYSHTLTSQKDWFDVKVDGIQFSGLDFERIMGKHEYAAQKVVLDGLDGLVYRDKSVPFQAMNDKGLPQTMLKNIDAWIYLDTLQVLGDLTYREIPDQKNENGELSFNDLNASLVNITTVESQISKPLHLYARGRLYNTAQFKVNVWFDMQHPKDQFTFIGQVDDMDLKTLNKMLRPVANINIRDGYAERIDFNINANNELARGEMNLRYNNLRIQILNPETNEHKNANQGFKTFFANTFVVDDKNPSFIVLKPGVIFQKRDTSRAIFQYWAKSLLSGAVSSIGINKSKKAEKKYGKEEKDE